MDVFVNNFIQFLFPRFFERLKCEKFIMFCIACQDLNIDDPTIWNLHAILSKVNDEIYPALTTTTIDKKTKQMFKSIRTIDRIPGMSAKFTHDVAKNYITIYGEIREIVLNRGGTPMPFAIARDFNLFKEEL